MQQVPTSTDHATLQHHSHESETMRDRLAGWLAERLPEGSTPELGDFDHNDANGFSSDTVLFTAAWEDPDGPRSERFVARLAPPPGEVAVFPSYDLQGQFDTMRIAGERCNAPVPRVWWSEPDPQVLGSPFFVMSHVDGVVPPDNLPYTFGDNWLFDSTAAQRATLEQSAIGVLAELHGIDDAERRFAHLVPDVDGDTALRRHVAGARRWYEWSLGDGPRSTLVERAFTWLDEHWPDDPGETVLSWGDSRIGNMIFADFEAAAVLDWEMAGLGPRELDLVWLVYSHRVFEDLAHMLGLPGMSGLLGADATFSAYERLTGHTPRDLRFHHVLAAVKWAVAFLRTGLRGAVASGEEVTSDGDSLLHNRPSIEALLEGTFVP